MEEKKVNGRREGERSDNWKRNFDVLTRALKRYEMFVRLSSRKEFTLDVDTIDKETIEDIESFLRNEYALAEEYPEIYKKIPVEAGLGGGSADAAAVIRAIDHFLPPSQDKEERIRELASRIGSDVPFCLYDRPSRVQGKGEVLTPIEVGYPYHVLIVKPSYGLSTKSVYEAFDTIEETIRRPNIERLIDALKKDDEEGMRQSMANVLSVPAIKALPLIGEILERMNAMGLPLNGMSGTGSACFALSKDKRHLERVAHVFEKEGNQAYVTQFCLAR